MIKLYGNVIFCDDFREEIGGLYSYIGVYENETIEVKQPNPQFPTFAMIITINTSKIVDRKKKFKLKIILENDKGQEKTLSDADFKLKDPTEYNNNRISFHTRITGLRVLSGDKIVVYASEDDKTLEIGRVLFNYSKKDT